MNNSIQCSIESSTTSMELNSAADGIFLVPELEGLAGLPEIRTTSGVNAGYDGGWTSAQNYDARLIAIRGVIANKDIATVEATRRKLASLLGQGRKEQLTLRFTTEAGNAYTISVRTISCEMALQRVLNKQDFLIQLRADDPLIYDDGASGGTEAILRVQQALGGFEINFGLPLAIGGSSDATAVENGAETVYPIIKLYGPLHSPTVVNMTTNQQMQIIADLGYTITWSGWTGVSGERLSIPNELDKEAPLRFWGFDGNATQTTYAGKNLLNTNALNRTLPYTSTSHGITFTLADDGSITLNGKNDGTGNSVFTIYNNTTPLMLVGGSYTGDLTPTGGVYRAVTMIVYDGAHYRGFAHNSTQSLNASNATAYLQVSNGETTQFSSYKIYPMLEAGTTKSPYEPYVGSIDGSLTPSPNPSYPQPIETVTGRQTVTVTGKNLWGGFANDFSKTSSGITFVTKADGAITNTAGTTSATAYSAFASDATNNGLTKTLEAGTYCISGASGNITLDVCDTSGATLVTDSGNGATFTLSAQKTVFVRIRVASGKTLTAGTTKPLLESGNQPTTYEPYEGQDYEIDLGSIELCKIGTYQDRIYKDGEKWYVEKQIGKVVLTGSAGIGQYNQTNNWFYVSYSSIGAGVGVQDGGIVSDYFTGTTPTYMSQHTTENGLCAMSVNNIFIRNTDCADTASYRTWLSAHNTTVYYALATPTTTEITNEEVLEGLEALGDATLYVGANNIYTDTPGALPTLEVDYPTDYDEIHDTITIDSQARTITLNGADIYHLKTEESEFPVLAPGENRMYLTSATTSDTGYAEVKFKQGYLSI